MAVDNVGFTVPDGQVGILLGPNGAGKSTIIKSIAGLLRYKGVIRIQGLPARTVEAKKVFAYVPEIPNMFDALTVREHIEYVRMAYNSGITDDEVEQILKEFEMDDKQDKLGNELSKGMMQKVSLYVYLLVKPQVILLDEPMVGLDPAAIKKLKEVVLELRDQGVTGADQHAYAGDGGGSMGYHVRNGERTHHRFLYKTGCRGQGSGRPVLCDDRR